MYNLEQEADFIKAFQEGNQYAFNDIFRKYYRPLCFFAYKYVPDVFECQDIVSDTFRKLFEAKEGFETRMAIKAFLYITTKNACLIFIRDSKKKNDRQKEFAYLSSEKEDSFLTEMMKAELVNQIYNEIENLPPQAKEVLKLIYKEEQSTDKIAEQLDIAIQSVRTNKAYALYLLRNILLKKRALAVTGWLILFAIQLFLYKVLNRH